MVKPAARRELVGYPQVGFDLSQRRACRLAGISREAMNYQPVDRGDRGVVTRLKTLGEQYPRYGYLMLHAMLKAEGLVQTGSAPIGSTRRWECRCGRSEIGRAHV